MSLYTLKGFSSWEETIKRSRFLVLADTVQTPEQALAFIDAHGVPDATHNCWAYQIGDQYRFSDDGEPGGTAGRPILQAIQGQECDRVVVLVVRWFGGTKLGTGGLIRAYGGCAAQCLRLADKSEIVEEVFIRCFCPFTDMARVQSRFSHYRITVTNEDFGAEGVNWTLRLPTQLYPEYKDLFIDQTSGQGDCRIIEPGSQGVL